MNIAEILKQATPDMVESAANTLRIKGGDPEIAALLINTALQALVDPLEQAYAALEAEYVNGYDLISGICTRNEIAHHDAGTGEVLSLPERVQLLADKFHTERMRHDATEARRRGTAEACETLRAQVAKLKEQTAAGGAS